MTRLNKSIREQILANAQTKSGNRKRREDTQNKRKAWDEAVRIESLGVHAELLESLDKEVEAIRQLVPIDFRGDDSPIQRRGSISVNCAGLALHVCGWEGYKVAPSRFTITADNPLAQKFHDICAEEKANTDQWEKVKASVNAATHAVSTVKALLKAWPEAKELLPAHVEESKPQLPAIQVADLNALVGLPSAE